MTNLPMLEANLSTLEAQSRTQTKHMLGKSVYVIA